MDQKPMVSVCMITYNHEKFIKEAIEGVLMQECNFEIELILANDSSTDKTDEVIQNILESHPRASWIKYTQHKKNIGMMPNFIWALQQCKGKYIALCEGDDYWTDPLKLQKQVDFLEENLEYIICFHRVQILENDILISDYIESRYNRIKNSPIGIIDLLEQGNFIHTPSVVFRNHKIKFTFEFNLATAGDYFLYIILTKNGYIKRLDETMAVYRAGVGIYSTLSKKEMQNKILYNQIYILSYLNNHLHKEIILKKILMSINSLNKMSIKDDRSLSIQLSVKRLIKLLLLKIKRKLA